MTQGQMGGRRDGSEKKGTEKTGVPRVFCGAPISGPQKLLRREKPRRVPLPAGGGMNFNPSFPTTQGELPRSGKRKPPGGVRVGNDTSHPKWADNFEEIEAHFGCNPPQKSGEATFLTVKNPG